MLYDRTDHSLEAEAERERNEQAAAREERFGQVIEKKDEPEPAPFVGLVPSDFFQKHFGV